MSEPSSASLAISAAILQQARKVAEARQGLEGYLAAYLPSHLSQAQAWEHLNDDDDDFLDELDLDAFAAESFRAWLTGAALPPIVLGTTLARPYLHSRDPAQRRLSRDIAINLLGMDRPAVLPGELTLAKLVPQVLSVTLTGYPGWINGVCTFNGPEGITLLATAGTDGVVRTWDPVTGTQIANFSGHDGRIFDVCAFDGTEGAPLLATVGTDSTLRIWNPATATQIAAFTSPRGPMHAVCALHGPDGMTLLATVDSVNVQSSIILNSRGDSDETYSTLRIWNPATGPQSNFSFGRINDMCTVDETDGAMLVAANSPLGSDLWTLNTATGELTLDYWSPQSAIHCVYSFEGSDGTTLVATAGPAGRADLSAGEGTHIVVIQERAGAPIATLSGHTGRIYDMCAFRAPDGTILLATAGQDVVRIWDPAAGTQTGVFTGHSGPVTSVCAFDGPDRTTLLATAGADRSVHIWDPATVTPSAVSVGRINGVCAFTGPDTSTRLATVGADSAVRIWDPTAGIETAVLTGHTGPVNGVWAFDGPNGNTLLATAGDDTVRIWDPATRTQISKLTEHSGRIHHLYTFHELGGEARLVTAGADGIVRIWDPFTSAQTAVFTGRIYAACSFEGSDGVALLATAGVDGILRIWDPIAPNLNPRLVGHAGRVHDMCAVKRPGETTLLAVAGADGTVLTWDPVADTQMTVLTGHTSAVVSVCAFLGPDGAALLATAGDDGTVRIVGVATGTCLVVRDFSPLRLTSVLARGNMLAVGSDRGFLLLHLRMETLTGPPQGGAGNA